MNNQIPLVKDLIDSYNNGTLPEGKIYACKMFKDYKHIGFITIEEIISRSQYYKSDEFKKVKSDFEQKIFWGK